jgi:hypothetical protein
MSALKRPKVKIQEGEQARILVEAAEALQQPHLKVFSRGDQLVRLIEVENSATKSPRLHLQQLDEHSLRNVISEAVEFTKFSKGHQAWRPADCPSFLPKSLLAKGAWPVPILKGVSLTPSIRLDGTLVFVPGYDAQTQFYFDFPANHSAIVAEQPGKDASRLAYDILAEIVGTFPFASDGSKTTAIALMMTAVVRSTLPSAPLFAIDAPTRGSGKSLLVDCASIVATGSSCAVASAGANDEELEKRLIGDLLAGEPMISLDNISRPITSAFLCQILTQQAVTVRRLGASSRFKVPCLSLVSATGNNLDLRGDLLRRAIWCRLDPKCEHPELAQFPRDARDYTREKRWDIILAVLTLLRGFHVAGRPKTSTPLGSFEEWSGLVRGALIWVGAADPCATMNDMEENDPSHAQLAALLAVWPGGADGHPCKAKDLIQAAEQAYANGPELHDALLEIARDGTTINSHRLGQFFSRNAGRVIEGRRITRLPAQNGVARWCVEQIDGGSAGESTTEPPISHFDL